VLLSFMHASAHICWRCGKTIIGMVDGATWQCGWVANGFVAPACVPSNKLFSKHGGHGKGCHCDTLRRRLDCHSVQLLCVFELVITVMTV
jgi:hypothetical protein